MAEAIHIIFDGPPAPESGRFVEVNHPDGHSVKIGRWEQNGQWWELIITPKDIEEAR